MTKNQEAIFALLRQYLEAHPGIRVGQALVNLDVCVPGHDVFYDKDDIILKRITEANQKQS